VNKVDNCQVAFYTDKLNYRGVILELIQTIKNLLLRRTQMKKGIVSVVLALTFALSTVAVAATVKCTVDSVEADKVTMTCKKADKMKAGDKVKVKVSSGAAVEGC